MSRKLLIATRNNGKRQELQEILGDSGIEILTLADFPGSPDVKEDGLSFAENAIKKAVSNAAYSGLTTLADDSGLVVDALGGAPGVYSARFAGSNASDEDNNRKLLELMKNIPEPDRTARFVCVIAVCTPDNGVYTVEGICPGRIIFRPRGQGGFGYDPLFVPDGFGETFAELAAETKNRISHRGQALQKAKPLLEELIG